MRNLMVDTIIVSGGNIQKDFALDFLKKKMCQKQTISPVLVAADKGLDFLEEISYLPDLVVGDFDSLSTKGKKYLVELTEDRRKKTEIVRLKPEKDDSDTQSAVNICIGRGAKDILILGATGTRVDHLWANIGLIAYGKSKGVHIALIDRNNYICLVDSGTIIRKKDQFGKYISFFPLGGDVTGLKLKGFRYPLEEYHLKITDSGLTVSNEIAEEEAIVEYKTGLLLMIMSAD